MNSRRGAYFASAVLCLLLAAPFGWAFYERYWRWRDCFNDQGRCWDPESEQVFLEQAGIVWGTPMLLFGAASLALLWVGLRAKPS